MKAVNIQWDNTEGTEGTLPSEITIPNSVLYGVEIGNKSVTSIYNDKVEAISDYLTEKTGFCHNGFAIRTEPSDAVRYCHAHGIGIVENGKTKEISDEYVQHYSSQDSCIKYAVVAMMSPIDLDEWITLNKVLGIKLSFEDAEKINGILWEDYNYSVLDVADDERQPLILPESVFSWIRDRLSELTDGTMEAEIYPSGYDDRISAATVQSALSEYQEEALSSIKFSDHLYNKIYEMFEDYNSFNFEIDYLFDQIEKAVEKESAAFQKAYSELKSELSPTEMLEEAGFNGFKFDINLFLSEYKINLLLATKAEENMDMSSIMDMCREGQETATDNALTFLINQQGHELSELKEENPDNGFVKSVIEEIDNFPYYSMAALTVCISAGGQTLLDLLDAYTSGEYDVSVSRNSFVGLFNAWLGTGSWFDIKLERDFTFPVSLIKEIQFEGANRGYGYYTVNKVYDFIPSVWRGEVRVAENEETHV